MECCGLFSTVLGNVGGEAPTLIIKREPAAESFKLFQLAKLSLSPYTPVEFQPNPFAHCREVIVKQSFDNRETSMRLAHLAKRLVSCLTVGSLAKSFSFRCMYTARFQRWGRNRWIVPSSITASM